jgi:hypothetical protein
MPRSCHKPTAASDAGDEAFVACRSPGSDCRLVPWREHHLSVTSARSGPTSFPLTWPRLVDCITHTSKYMLTKHIVRSVHTSHLPAPHFGWLDNVAKRPIPARRISRRLLRDMWSIRRHGHISAQTITHDDPHSSSNSRTPFALALCSDDVFRCLCRM